MNLQGTLKCKIITGTDSVLFQRNINIWLSENHVSIFFMDYLTMNKITHDESVHEYFVSIIYNSIKANP